MKLIQSCVRFIETILLIIGIIFFAFKIMHVDIYMVLSGSMNPEIETGAIVLVDTVEKDYVIGDIITYCIDDQLVTHRIVEMNNEFCRTKGDANEMPDPVYVKISQILGKVIYIIPKAGYVLSFLKSYKIIFVMLTALLLSNVFDILSKKSNVKHN